MGILRELGEFTIGGVTVEEGRGSVGGLRLRRFQEEILELYTEASRGVGPRSVLAYLKAPTGAGKTLTLLTPLMAAQEGRLHAGPESPLGSMAVYPSRKLLVDQACNLQRLLGLLGYKGVELDGGLAVSLGRVEAPWGYCPGGEPSRVLAFYEGPVGRVAVLLLFSDALDRLEAAACGEEGCGGRRRLYEALENALLREARVSAIVSLATTEYPSLFLEALAWGQRDLEYFLVRGAGLAACLAGQGGDCPQVVHEGLRRDDRARALALFKLLFAGDMLFIDEAHLYSGSSALTVAAAASWYLAYGGLRTSFLVVSTATHSGAGYEALRSVLDSAAEALGARVERVEARPGDVLVRKPVKLRIYGYARRGGPMPRWAEDAVAQEALPRLADEDLVVSVASQIVGGGRTFMLLGGRLYYVRLAGERLAEALEKEVGGGFTVECVDSLARLDPLRPSYCRQGEGGRLVVGTSAVSYGVDYPDADGGLVYARSPSEAIQKLGRLGRRPGEGPDAVEAFLLTGYLTARSLARALAGEASREGGVVEPGVLEEALAGAFSRSRPPVPPSRLRALQAVKAVYQLALMALAFHVAFRHDAAASSEPPLRLAERLAKAIVGASGAEPGEVARLAESLARAAPPPGPAARSLWPAASPRTILTVSIAGSEAPLHQALRLHLYTDPTVTGRLDFAVVVDDWQPLEGALDKFLPGSSLVRALEEAGASLVQLDHCRERYLEESGLQGFRAVAGAIRERLVYAASLGASSASAVAAYTVYHEMGGIPVVHLQGQVRGVVCGLLDLLESASEVAVIVPL